MNCTDMSPIQYQKRLRLHEARRLMLEESYEVGTAALDVGYESSTQFIREYRRLFGEAPLRNIKALRTTGVDVRRNLSKGSIHGCGPADQIVQRESGALHSTIDDGGLFSILCAVLPGAHFFLVEPRSEGFDRFDYPWQDNY